MNFNSTAVEYPTLRQQLRQLLLIYSASEIHETLLQMFREDFEFYKTLFKTPQATQAPPPPSTTPLTPTPQISQEVKAKEEPVPTQKKEAKLRGDVRVMVKKMPASPEDTIESLKVDSLPDSPDSHETPVALHPQKKSKEQLKAEQNEKVASKKKELEGLGVDPLGLLTEDNLRAWVEVKGLTYAQVARDYVGLSEKIIAEAARGFNITSSISKKRAAIIASKGKK